VEECLQTIDFMYRYVDLYMQHKKPSQRKVILNVYGGESLFHPNIETILVQCREKYKSYKDRWHLTITCTTNGVVGARQWSKIVDLIDEFTVSYHPENLPKQKQQYLDNVVYLKNHNKRFKCVIMMHNRPDLFEDSQTVIDFCQQQDMRWVAKPLDNHDEKWNYSQQQFNKLKTIWIEQIPQSQKLEYKKKIDLTGNESTVSSISQGRACCGGRKLSLNGDLRNRVGFVPQQGFKGWSCSVNWFFLFVQQLTGNVYTNKDCRMSTTNQIEALGNLHQADQILDTLSQQLLTKSMPIIECKKEICLCGICAPKSQNQKDFLELIQRNISESVFDVQ
jgi:pyruvate-formate lyase-activating enzyme